MNDTTRVLYKLVDQLEKRLAKQDACIASLFDAIKHGDEQHQAWLKAKIDEHFGLTDND